MTEHQKLCLKGNYIIYLTRLLAW